MRIVEQYSHLNGREHILVHKPQIWQEILAVIQNIDAEKSSYKSVEGKDNERKTPL